MVRKNLSVFDSVQQLSYLLPPRAVEPKPSYERARSEQAIAPTNTGYC